MGLGCHSCTGEVNNVIYDEYEENNFKPRAILVDTDPYHINDLKNGYARNVFLNSNYLSGEGSSGSLFPVGLHNKLGEKVQEKFRQILEKCETLQGIVLAYSYGGGTGSGLGTYITMKMPQKKPQVHFCLTPNPKLNSMGGGPLEAYNTGLTLNKTEHMSNCNIIAENDAMYRLSEKKSLLPPISQPWINRLLSVAINIVSSGWRYSSGSSIKIGDLATNLVVNPTMKFATLSFSPLCGRYPTFENFTGKEIIRAVFERGCYFLTCEPKSGQIASCIICRGSDFNSLEIKQVIAELVKRGGIRFATKWAPKSIKVGITEEIFAGYPGWCPPRCGTLVTNTRAICPTWDKVQLNFSRMLEKKAFLHWYLTEGMEIGEFMETRETLANITSNYYQ